MEELTDVLVNADDSQQANSAFGHDNEGFSYQDGALMSEQMLSSEDTLIQPLPLSEGKEYHVFISHDSNDRDYAEELLDILEAHPYNLKCCFADRDFISGRSVIENIELCMEKSSFVLFLLTQDFLESNYCDYEKNVAQEIACSGEPHFQIVPMLLKDCQIPRSLRFVNYIDAREKSPLSVVEERLYTAIAKGDGEFLPKNYNWLNRAKILPPDVNGNKVTLSTTNGSSLKRSPLSAVVADLTDETIEKCSNIGVKITDKLCREICSVVNEAPLLRYYNLLFNNCKLFVIFVLTSTFLGSFIISGTSAFCLLLDIDDFSFYLTFVIVTPIICSALVFIVEFIAVFLSRRKIYRLNADYMGEVSQHSFKRLKFLTHIVHVPLIGMTQGPSVCLVKYDSDDCRSYIAETLLHPGQLVSKRQAAEMAERADDIILRAIPGYNEVLRQGQMGTANPRHLVLNEIVCLCQYVETENLHIRHTKTRPRERLGRDGREGVVDEGSPRGQIIPLGQNIETYGATETALSV